MHALQCVRRQPPALLLLLCSFPKLHVSQHLLLGAPSSTLPQPLLLTELGHIIVSASMPLLLLLLLHACLKVLIISSISK
jgi:hypothetical protein